MSLIQISREPLESAVAAMRSDLSGRPADERRLQPRYCVWAPAMVVPCDDGRKGRPIVRGVGPRLSRGGLSFMSFHQLKMGHCFRFTLPSADAASPALHTTSQVAYCSPAAACSHTIGAKFVRDTGNAQSQRYNSGVRATGDSMISEAQWSHHPGNIFGDQDRPSHASATSFRSRCATSDGVHTCKPSTTWPPAAWSLRG